MTPFEMKPETVVRRAEKRAASRAEAKEVRIQRLRELVDREGPTSIWAELLDIEYELGRLQ